MQNSLPLFFLPSLFIHLTFTGGIFLKQTLLTQFSEKPFFEWKGNIFEILDQGIFKEVKREVGLAGLSHFVYENNLDNDNWYAIITKSGYISITHWGCSNDVEFLQENNWIDTNTYNQLCPFREFFEKYLEAIS